MLRDTLGLRDEVGTAAEADATTFVVGLGAAEAVAAGPRTATLPTATVVATALAIRVTDRVMSSPRSLTVEVPGIA
jgi:hypothetical protein